MDKFVLLNSESILLTRKFLVESNEHKICSHRCYLATEPIFFEKFVPKNHFCFNQEIMFADLSVILQLTDLDEIYTRHGKIYEEQSPQISNHFV